MRLVDGDSSRGWFNALARSDADVRAVRDAAVTGYPLESVTGNGSGTDSPCAASPLASKNCGGYQYQAPATISTMNATFLELATDWDRGQSGGPIRFAAVCGGHGPCVRAALRGGDRQPGAPFERLCSMTAQQFASDNYAGVCPAVRDAMPEANQGHQPAHGDDAWTGLGGGRLSYFVRERV